MLGMTDAAALLFADRGASVTHDTSNAQGTIQTTLRIFN
jgi:hypothetical protein